MYYLPLVVFMKAIISHDIGLILDDGLKKGHGTDDGPFNGNDDPHDLF